MAFFFKKRKRRYALSVGLFVNIITWPIVNIIRLNTDWDLNWVQVGVVVVEGFAYWLLLGRHIKRSIIMTIVANAASFLATKYIHISPDLFQKTPNLIR
ncbi:MAG: hypothetical protein IPP72_10725 [Chitinophagaceae bacterium]|nr:hypothetical protein [Chitinophagaceae bacterium]